MKQGEKNNWEGGGGGEHSHFLRLMHCTKLYRVNTLLKSGKFYFFPLFSRVYCPNEIFPMGNLRCIPQEKPSATGSLYPTYGARWVF